MENSFQRSVVLIFLQLWEKVRLFLIFSLRLSIDLKLRHLTGFIKGPLYTMVMESQGGGIVEASTYGIGRVLLCRWIFLERGLGVVKTGA